MNLRQVVGGLPYMVSDCGQVFSLKSMKPLKQATVNGYKRVTLCDGGKRVQANVHVLVLEAFVSIRFAGMVANHKNGNKTDNRIENLEWVTQSENVTHAYKSGLREIGERHRKACAEVGRKRRTYTDEQAELIRAGFSGERGDIARLARDSGFSRDVITWIVKGAA